MKKFSLFIFLSIIGILKLHGQATKGDKIIIDTIYSENEDHKPQYERYYFEEKRWNSSTKRYYRNSMAYTEKKNKIFIYYRPLEKGILSKTDTINKVSSRNISLYMMKDGILIQNSSMGVINAILKSLAKRGDKKEITIHSKKLMISTPISIYNCIISVNGRLDQGIDSTIYNKAIKLTNNSFTTFYLNNTIFNDTCKISFKENLSYFTKKTRLSGIPEVFQALFRNTTFNGPFLLANSEELDRLKDNYYDYSIPKRFYTRETERFYPLNNINFRNVNINNSLIINATSLKNFLFDNVTFNTPLILANLKLDSTVFNNCYVNSEVVDLRGILLFNGSTFKNNFFKQNCNLLLNRDNEIEKLSLDNIELQKVFFLIDWGWDNAQVKFVRWNGQTKSFDVRFYPKYKLKHNEAKSDPLGDFSEHNLETVKREFQKIKDYANKTITSDDILGSDKQRISNWLNYQDKQYEKLYYKNNDRLYYYWLLFLESTVNFGYSGEGNFIKFCLVIIFVFSLIYKIWFKVEVSAYINKKNIKPVENNSANNTVMIRRFKKIIQNLFIFDINFIKSVYLSFTIFFSPIFPSLIFKYSKTFFWLIILEWLIGLLFILLFLYFIAGNYPVVTKLIGLK